MPRVLECFIYMQAEEVYWVELRHFAKRTLHEVPDKSTCFISMGTIDMEVKLNTVLKRIFPTLAKCFRENVHEELCTTKNACSEPVFQLLEDSCDFLKEGNFHEALSLCQTVVDLSWEKINTGYWKNVDVEWRKTYSLASVLKSTALYSLGRLEDAVKSCDMGLLMGYPILDNVLVDIVTSVQEALSTVNDKSGSMTSNLQHAGIDMSVNKTKRPRLYQSCDTENSIQKVRCPSLQTFKNEFMCKEQPVIIEGTMDHWPAMTSCRWSFSYLKDVAGCRTVPVEIGSRYTDETWTQKLLTINEFVDSYIVKDDPNCETPKAYLAQHQLFDQIPQLANDVQVPDYCCLGNSDGDDVVMNAWFGPSGTVSPLHHDPSHNLLAQVVGQKYLRIYSTSETDKLYPHESYLLCTTSQVDVEKPDLERFPRFKSAVYKECILSPGEMLYIPPEHWHFVKSLSISFSVSFWWN